MEKKMPLDNLLQETKEEALELLEHAGTLCESLLINLQKNQEPTQEEIHELFRDLHTLKSLAHMAEKECLSKLLHKVETFVDLFRQGIIKPHSSHIEQISEVIPIAEEIMSNIEKKPQTEIEEISLQLEAYFEDLCQDIKKESVKESETLEIILTEEYKEKIEAFLQKKEDWFYILISASQEKEFLDCPQIDALNRCSDILWAHFSKNLGIVLFSSELDISILESLLECPIYSIQNKETFYSEIQEPWNNLEIWKDLNIKKNKEEEDILNIELHHESQHEVEETSFYEDFDSKNLTMEVKTDILDPEMLDDFLANVDSLLENLSDKVLILENNPTDKDAIENIFRSAHTIKGTAGMFGFRAIEKLTHVMENMFDSVRKNKLLLNSDHIDAILFAFDKVKEMFEHIKSQNSSEHPINDALEKLNQSLSGKKASSIQENKQIKKEEIKKEEIKKEEIKKEEIKKEVMIKNDDKKADKKADKNENPKKELGSIRVDLGRLDSLVNLVGELVIDRTRFFQIEEDLRSQNANSELLHSMSEALLLFGRHMNEVQNIIMKIRMVPIGNAFSKFSRVVRDLAKDCKKEVELILEGSENELDKTLVEEIGDPLIHLVRNSIDHGIETPEERIKKGKKPKGILKLSAQQDGNMIIIRISDDGKGLPVERIKSKAIQNGLIGENEILSEKEIFNLIFEPGFSTAEAVTNISGRGVGMDVVKKNIIKLKGIIDLDSKSDKGTTISIKLPLTLAIVPSLMIITKGEHYAIPLVNVIESIRTTNDQIEKIGHSDFIRLRDRVLPLIHLTKIFDLDNMHLKLWYKTESPTIKNKRNKKDRLIYVVLGVGEKRIGLVVDELVGQQEIVIKSLGPLIRKPIGVAGACVLGNGVVSLVLDVGEITENLAKAKKGN